MWLAGWFLRAILHRRSADEVTRGFWFLVGLLAILLIIVPALLHWLRD